MNTEYTSRGTIENRVDGTFLFPYYDENMVSETFVDHCDDSNIASHVDLILFEESNISIEELPADLANYLS